MSRSPEDPDTEELLADQALFGRGCEEDPTFELAAAAVDLATLRREPMPAALRGRLERTLVPRVEPTRAQRLARSGWVTAAACAVVAAAGWASFVLKTAPPVVVDRIVPGPPIPLPLPLPLEEQRAELLRLASDVVITPWTPTKDAVAAGVSGDVVWSETEQRGFMRFHGLAPNDPQKVQYQLWVFDKTQEHPVDGGVFDVSARGDVTVPITAKLHVREPQLFAVTVERPGGVVVSKKEHIVVTAAYGAG